MTKCYLLFLTLESSMSMYYYFFLWTNKEFLPQGKECFWNRVFSTILQRVYFNDTKKQLVCFSARKHEYVLLIIRKENTYCSEKYTVPLHCLTRNHSITLEKSIYLSMPETNLACVATNDACGMRLGSHFQLRSK